jgi:SWI/SNF-related matrix-associated actin-dependent regulator of chromatin subfamily D
MYLEQTPEQYKVSPDLGNSFVLLFAASHTGLSAYVLGLKEESRIGVIQTLWNYIKLNGLQDKVDRRRIRADDYLRPVREWRCGMGNLPEDICFLDLCGRFDRISAAA